MKSVIERFEAVTQRHANILFWGALTCVLASLIAPIWVGSVTPITDFGGHLQMVDAYVRYDVLSPLNERVVTREAWLSPNLIPARFADLLYPLLSPNQALRLFLTLVVLGLAGALLLCLREFGRSRVLVFICLPFLWGGMMGLGLINYVGTYPLLFAGVAFARRTGRDGRRSDQIALLILSCLAFFMHGLGFLFVFGLVALSLLLALKDRRGLKQFLWLSPSLGLWLFWLVMGPLSIAGNDSLSQATSRVRYQSLGDKLNAFRGDALDVLVGTADEVALLSLVLILTAWTIGRRPGSLPLRQGKWIEKVRARPLVLLWGVSVLSVLTLPTYVGSILVDTRMVTPVILFTCMLPRPLQSRGLARTLGTAAAITAIGFGASLTVAANLYHEREIEPLTHLMSDLPKNVRAECVQVGRVNSLFKRRPLSHNCNAIIQTERDSFAGAGFAYTRFNAIQFRRGEGYHSLRKGDWQRSRTRSHWDYVIVRGDHRPPLKGHFTLVNSVSSTHSLGSTWSLYKMRH
jgi:hypothetical protein